MINIYAADLWLLCLLACCGMLAWYALARCADKSNKAKTWFRSLSILMVALAVYGILAYTVLHRNPGEIHRFVLINQGNHEFFRELFMNGLLYLPLGLSLSALIGPWSILIAFLLSTGIETWQYLAGTGLAQGTDVLMNTLGASIGAIPLLVNKKRKDGI